MVLTNAASHDSYDHIWLVWLPLRAVNVSNVWVVLSVVLRSLFLLVAVIFQFLSVAPLFSCCLPLSLWSYFLFLRCYSFTSALMLLSTFLFVPFNFVSIRESCVSSRPVTIILSVSVFCVLVG